MKLSRSTTQLHKGQHSLPEEQHLVEIELPLSLDLGT